MESSDDAESGEQVVVIFLESGSAAAVQLVTGALERRGFDVYPATADESGPSAGFDYEQARFLVAVLRGEPSSTARPELEQPVVASRVEPATGDIKVLLFPGVTTAAGNPDLFNLEWDPGEAWLDRVVGAIRLLNPD